MSCLVPLKVTGAPYASKSEWLPSLSSKELRLKSIENVPFQPFNRGRECSMPVPSLCSDISLRPGEVMSGWPPSTLLAPTPCVDLTLLSSLLTLITRDVRVGPNPTHGS